MFVIFPFIVTVDPVVVIIGLTVIFIFDNDAVLVACFTVVFVWLALLEIFSLFDELSLRLFVLVTLFVLEEVLKFIELSVLIVAVFELFELFVVSELLLLVIEFELSIFVLLFVDFLTDVTTLLFEEFLFFLVYKYLLLYPLLCFELKYINYYSLKFDLLLCL